MPDNLPQYQPEAVKPVLWHDRDKVIHKSAHFPIRSIGDTQTQTSVSVFCNSHKVVFMYICMF